MYYFGQSSHAMLTTLQPRLQKALEQAIATSPVDFGIVSPTGGRRTEEMQRKLFDDGKSNCDGFNKQSYHQTGWAVDVFAYVDGKAVWDGQPMFEVVAHIIQVAAHSGLVLEWGGLWKATGRDTPHLQVVKIFDRKTGRRIMPSWYV